MRRLMWLLGMCALSGAAVAEDAALRALDACRARLDARVDIGIERIRARCPELLPALAQAPWRELLPGTLGERREEISAESLRVLAELVRHAAEVRAQRAPPAREQLDPVLTELGAAGKQGATRWERFKRWLKHRIEDREKDDGVSWLDRWSRQFRTSEGIAQAITYIGYALLSILVVMVVVAELRAAGLLDAARRAAREASPATVWRRRLMMADVLEAPLADRPGMLLRLLAEVLTRTRRLPAADGLTAGAIARRARLDLQTEREALARVAATAESARYAARQPEDAVINDAVEAARGLLDSLAKDLQAGR